jgi:hypothetical protein
VEVVPSPSPVLQQASSTDSMDELSIQIASYPEGRKKVS